MSNTIEVATADFAVAGPGYVLTSGGVGSCVVVCLYDAGKKIGALCHIMLPKHQSDSALNPLRFADTALTLALQKLVEMGATPTQLTAQLFGGAHMFQGLGPFINQIGDQNVQAAQQFLGERHIPIERTDTGGNAGRSVSFATDSGNATVTTKV
ncbi:MAG TPA: chemotaxis protein CheD [Candidatus Saccharimonadales bacterium]|nr:chemotaxis protein CheD [Candidatus Saccharimonadales bacterium]